MIDDLRTLAALVLICTPGIAFWAALAFTVRSFL